jgi:hypothetical protein
LCLLISAWGGWQVVAEGPSGDRTAAAVWEAIERLGMLGVLGFVTTRWQQRRSGPERDQ